MPNHCIHTRLHNLQRTAIQGEGSGSSNIGDAPSQDNHGSGHDGGKNVVPTNRAVLEVHGIVGAQNKDNYA